MLCECDLLKSIMSKISDYSTAPSAPPSKVASSASLKGTESEEGSSSSSSDSVKTHTPAAIMPKHSSVMGHLVLIAQVISVICLLTSVC